MDPDSGQLHYFVNEQGKSQKPRGCLPLIGASVTQSDEAPHMFIVHSVTGELYKLRGKTWCQFHSTGTQVWPVAHTLEVLWMNLFSPPVFMEGAGMLLIRHFLVAEHEHIEDADLFIMKVHLAIIVIT